MSFISQTCYLFLHQVKDGWAVGEGELALPKNWRTSDLRERVLSA